MRISRRLHKKNGGKMRKIVMTVMAAVLFFALTDRLCGAEGIAKDEAPARTHIGVSTEPARDEKKDEEERKAAEEARKIVVARVNGAEINMFMLARTMNRVAGKYVKEGKGMTPETTEKIEREALDRLIFEELAVQEAITQGIHPEPEAIEKIVAQVRENAGSEQAYREYLEKSFLNEETLRKMIERSQRFELITAREIYGKVKIDEKVLRAEYEKEKGKFILPEDFLVEDVFFFQGKDETATRKKADEILKTIRKNNKDVWKLVLDGAFIVRKIPVRKDKHPEIYNAMAEMKAGDLSSVIQDKDGFHIIKVIRKEPSRQLTFEEARSALEPRFLVPAQDMRKEEWTRELRERAHIEVLLDGAEKDIREGARKQEEKK
jgi:hypothetical protein